MQIRHAQTGDLPVIMEIYRHAREFMAASGNPGQWGSSYPARSVVEGDLSAGALYVCEDEDSIAAVFAYFTGEEPTYRKIEQGAWLNDRPYGFIHRIASARRQKGAAAFCINWCFSQCQNLRIDTHRNNLPMRRLLEKCGFSECGIVYMADKSERIAYQKSGSI